MPTRNPRPSATRQSLRRTTDFCPLRSFAVRPGVRTAARAKARPGRLQRLASAVDACGTDSPALLGLVARCRTRFVRRALCTRTAATSRSLTRADRRAATSPAMLGACDARCILPGRAFAEAHAVLATNTPVGGTRAMGTPPGAISEAASSAVAAQRLLPRHEPLVGSPWRNALNARTPGGRSRTAAMGRQRTIADHPPVVAAAGSAQALSTR
jgi:hypothetical protein